MLNYIISNILLNLCLFYYFIFIMYENLIHMMVVIMIIVFAVVIIRILVIVIFFRVFKIVVFVRIRFGLFLILVICIIMSMLGLKTLMALSVDIAFILYPVLIALTLCNMAYKLFNFKPVKTPVFLALVLSLFIKLNGFEFCKNCLVKYCSPEICIEKVIDTH